MIMIFTGDELSTYPPIIKMKIESHLPPAGQKGQVVEPGTHQIVQVWTVQQPENPDIIAPRLGARR